MNDRDFNHWLTGFLDGEGCFNINRDGVLELVIRLDPDDVEILHQIRDYAGGSVNIVKSGSRFAAQYRASTRRDALRRWVRFFERHPLRARKRAEMEVWVAAAKEKLGQRRRSVLLERRDELMCARSAKAIR